MIRNSNDIVNAELEGRVREYMWRKNPSQTTVSGYWFDLSLSPGSPPPKYWFDASPTIGVQVKQSTDGGMFHGADVNPMIKYLRGFSIRGTAAAGLPLSFKLMDYILYYPSVDDSTVGETAMTSNFNTLCTFTTPTPPLYQSDLLTLTTNNLANLTRCRVSSSGTLPSGLTADTDYWAIKVSDTTCRLATSRANAVAGTFFHQINDSGTGTHYLKTILPRYTDGAGLQIMPVSVAGRTGGFTFNVTYTNSSGVAGRVTQTVMENAQPYLGVIVTSNPVAVGNYTGEFVPLQAGDTGVQSIDSVNMITGDVGLVSLILVKPLAETVLKEITAPMERDFFVDCVELPEIKDDAFLNMICLPTGSLAATGLLGSIKVIWN